MPGENILGHFQLENKMKLNQYLTYEEISKLDLWGKSGVTPNTSACPNCAHRWGSGHRGTMCRENSEKPLDPSKFWPLESLLERKPISLDKIFSFIFFKREQS